MKLTHDAGQRQRATAPSQLCDQEGKQLTLHSAFLVLDDSAQLKVNVSILSTFKVG